MKAETLSVETIVPIASEHEERCVATLVAAFAADPAARWMYPDAKQYFDHFPGFVRALGGRAFECDTADWTVDFAGIALWLPPDVPPDEDAIGRVLEGSLSGEHLGEVASVLEQMGRFHPPGPHWYLPLIGVDPGVQRRGLGSALLQRAVERCDREGLPAYLEATSARNVPLYERFGFVRVGWIQTVSSPPITPMVRLPR